MKDEKPTPKIAKHKYLETSTCLATLGDNHTNALEERLGTGSSMYDDRGIIQWYWVEGSMLRCPKNSRSKGCYTFLPRPIGGAMLPWCLQTSPNAMHLWS